MIVCHLTHLLILMFSILSCLSPLANALSVNNLARVSVRNTSQLSNHAVSSSLLILPSRVPLLPPSFPTTPPMVKLMVVVELPAGVSKSSACTRKSCLGCCFCNSFCVCTCSFPFVAECIIHFCVNVVSIYHTSWFCVSSCWCPQVIDGMVGGG